MDEKKLLKHVTESLIVIWRTESQNILCECLVQ
jgi:hypothetical protein